jgi:hypothetical protein
MEPKGNPDWFTNRFNELNIGKLRALWVPEQAVMPGESGQSSRNVADTLQSSIDEVAALEMMLFDHVINRYVIPDFVRLNFPDFKGTCEKVTRGFAQEDVTLARQLVQVFGQKDPMALHVDMDELLNTMGIPMLQGAALQARMEQFVKESQMLQPTMMQPGGGDAGVMPQGDGGGLAPNQNGKELQAAIDEGHVTMKYVADRPVIHLSADEVYEPMPEVVFCAELPVACAEGVVACVHEGRAYVLESVPANVAQKYADATRRMDLAADSLAKASTHEPFGKPGGPGLWHHKGKQLPAYIQHIAHALVRSGHDESSAIAIAVGSVKRWASGGGNVDAGTRAAAAKAVGEWEAAKAESHAITAAKQATRAARD